MNAVLQLNMAEEMRKEAIRINGVNFTGNAARYGTQSAVTFQPSLGWKARAALSEHVAGQGWKQPTAKDFTSSAQRSGIRGLASGSNAFVKQTPLAVREAREGLRKTFPRLFANPTALDYRNTVAHEAFHVKNPVLGRSETLARFYGGWRAPRGAAPQLGRAGATWLERLKNGLADVAGYYRNDIPRYSPILRSFGT